MSVLHHIQKRKNLAPYPHPNMSVRFIDGMATCAGIIGPLMTVPQLFRVYAEHQAAGLSVVSWFSWALLDIPFIVYGIVHKDRVIIVTYTGWFLLNSAVAVGAIIYG